MTALSDIMSKQVQYCTPVDNVYEVAVKMKKWNVGAIPICEDGNLIGMITDRDLVIRGIAEKHPGSTKVTDVMSDKLITASPEMSAEEAAEIMAEHQIRRLPIVEESKLVGIISLGDLSLARNTKDDAGIALTEISEKPELHH
ncbi:CBS domain-containing protein [Pseudalkalibacillus caeni]|uniref:CBS domain-containing protein n=1 Tax=Exobacillus caeni TaxID=2574798 RepID=A0A5R9F5A4_9BACL|nr:CBS domain-containing protein [Pseudalkalibacillus caeni]TLS37659.1 CBS domain-containing protein [Pseudalkalibacillus caeni]